MISPEINCEGIEFLGPLKNKILRIKVMPNYDTSLIPYLRHKLEVVSLLESMVAGLPIEIYQKLCVLHKKLC